jgi:cytochrome c oxidase subunit 3
MIGITPSTLRDDRADRSGGGGEISTLSAASVGVWAFMGVATTIFLLLTLAFLARSNGADWHSLAEPNGPLSRPWPLWINSGLLLIGSLALAAANIFTRRGNATAMRYALAIGAVFAVGFLIGQLLFWQRLNAGGYLIATNPANSFFYLITALHGLHLLGGLAALARVAVKLWHGVAIYALQPSIRLTARYWHFLLVLWLAMFALLASSDAALAALAKLCGMR